jgi:hypothetical protein
LKNRILSENQTNKIEFFKIKKNWTEQTEKSNFEKLRETGEAQQKNGILKNNNYL